MHSHLFRLRFVLVVVIVVVIVISSLRLLVGLGLLRIVLHLLLGILMLAEGLPLLHEGICLGNIIRDDHVVKDGAALHLPEIEANETKVRILTEGVVVHILRICNLLRLPTALVGRVRNALDVPITLVGRIVLHRGLPFAILLIVPIIRLLRLLVDNPLLLGPIVGLRVLGVVHHRI